MDNVRPVVALWTPRHVDWTVAEEALGILRQAGGIVGSARRAEAAGHRTLAYLHGLCSVRHETTDMLATHLSVVLADASLEIRVPALAVTGEHLRRAPDGDPDPARFAIAAIDTLVTALAAFADAATSFADDETGLPRDLLAGATRAAIVADAPHGSGVVARSPWSSACLTDGGDTLLPMSAEATLQFDALPTAFRVERAWRDAGRDGTPSYHVELCAYGFWHEADDVVEAMRLAARPLIRPINGSARMAA